MTPQYIIGHPDFIVDSFVEHSVPPTFFRIRVSTKENVLTPISIIDINRSFFTLLSPLAIALQLTVDKVVFANEGADCLLVTLSKHILLFKKSFLVFNG